MIAAALRASLKVSTVMCAAACACSEVLRVIWTALMKSINMTGKNQQQVSSARLRGNRGRGWGQGPG